MHKSILWDSISDKLASSQRDDPDSGMTGIIYRDMGSKPQLRGR